MLRLGEVVAPMFFYPRRGDTPRQAGLGHGWRNVALGLINASVAVLLVGGLWAASEWSRLWGDGKGFGALHWVDELPVSPGFAVVVAWVAALLLLDLFQYGFHVLAHYAPPLWRLHQVHHHDEEVNVTSSLRFHTVEVVIQSGMLMVLAVLAGITMPQVFVYNLVLLPVAMFHHANMRLPARLDAVLRAVIVTPRMHWVHHSRWHRETDSNFSAVLSVWDRLFGTFRLREEPATIRFGLDGFLERDHATLRGMLATPFLKRKSEPGEPPPEALGEVGPTRRPQRDPRDAACEDVPPPSSPRPCRAASSP